MSTFSPSAVLPKLSFLTWALTANPHRHNVANKTSRLKSLRNWFIGFSVMNFGLSPILGDQTTRRREKTRRLSSDGNLLSLRNDVPVRLLHHWRRDERAPQRCRRCPRR